MHILTTATMDYATSRITVQQIIWSENDSEFGRDLANKVRTLLTTADVDEAIISKLNYVTFARIANAIKPDLELPSVLPVEVVRAVPYFIRTPLRVADNLGLYDWQKTFFKEASQRWRGPAWREGYTTQLEPAQSARLLQVAACGSGKSLAIVMAPFLGARQRVVVVVLAISIQEGLRTTLAENEHGALFKRNLFNAEVAQGSFSKSAPRLVVLDDLSKLTTEDKIARMLESEIVLTTAQTLKGIVDAITGWMQEHNQVFFDLMIVDDAHSSNTAWRNLGDKFREFTPRGKVFNELLLTATPHHHTCGNLDNPRIRDAPALTPFTLHDGVDHRMVKKIVLLEIQDSSPSDNLQVLLLCGDKLACKMNHASDDEHNKVQFLLFSDSSAIASNCLLKLLPPHLLYSFFCIYFFTCQLQAGEPIKTQIIPHRALIFCCNKFDAWKLKAEYDALAEDLKPKIEGKPMRVGVFLNEVEDTKRRWMQELLNQFQNPSAANPIHCMIQLGKLAEGYDQQNISVAGICKNVGDYNTFPQFVGRAVRKFGSQLGEIQLRNIVDERDNVAHVIVHKQHQQMLNWTFFCKQKGHGTFNEAKAQAIEEAREKIADEDEEPLAISTSFAVTDSGDDGTPAKKRQKRAGIPVHRYAMACTRAACEALLETESNGPYCQYNSRLNKLRNWEVENRPMEKDL